MTETGESERPPSPQDQIIGARAAAERAKQAGDLSPHETERVSGRLRKLLDGITQRRLGY
jgi:hypothetical protein